MQDSKELAIRDSKKTITSFDYKSDVFRTYFTSPFDQYKDYVGKPFKVLKTIRPLIPETENCDAEDDMYSIEFTDCGTKIDAYGHEVCQLNYESCYPKFENEEKQQNNHLFNENEALTNKGQIISIAFRDMIRNYLMEQSDKFSTIELEHVCINELHCLMAEIRLLKAMKTINNDKITN